MSVVSRNLRSAMLNFLMGPGSTLQQIYQSAHRTSGLVSDNFRTACHDLERSAGETIHVGLRLRIAARELQCKIGRGGKLDRKREEPIGSQHALDLFKYGVQLANVDEHVGGNHGIDRLTWRSR